MLPQGSTWKLRKAVTGSELCRYFLVATSNTEVTAWSDPEHDPDEHGHTWHGPPGVFVKLFEPIG
jgi:hypothetical protein